MLNKYLPTTKLGVYMKKYLFLLSILLFGNFIYLYNSQEVEMNDNVYHFSAKTIDGKDLSLDNYEGKVLLIVNVASKCGFTNQYDGLEEIYKQYKDKGFEILAFPCNQFGKQEPGTSEEIAEFCEINYGISFQLFEKIDVNGDNQHPLYAYLKANAKGLIIDDIKWNFTKFLIGKDGVVLERFAPQTTPQSIAKHLEELLK